MPDRLSRADAVARGNTRYFTGDPCPKGHVAERMVSTRACVACLSEKKAIWNAANPEQVNAQKRAWVAANPERAKALKAESQRKHRESANRRNREWRERNLKQANAATAAWQAANPGRCAAKAARRRAKLLQCTPPWADHELIASIYELARVYRDAGHKVEVDHIVPLQGRRVSGLHVQDNLQIIPSLVNKSKCNHFAVH